MKCALLIPFLVLGGALWGVNWRLDHPPLTQADLAFSRLIQGADEVKVSEGFGDAQATFTGERLMMLLNQMRFDNDGGVISLGDFYVINFRKQGRSLCSLEIDKSHQPASVWTHSSSNGRFPHAFMHALNGRCSRHLALFLRAAVNHP